MDPSKSSIQPWDDPAAVEAYEAFAETHERYQVANLALIDNAALAPGQRVLDVGAGTGRTTGLVLPHLGDDDHVLCVEPATAMRERGSARIDDGRVQWQSDLPPAGAMFDRILCGAAIWQMLPLEDTLPRLAGFLSPGGSLSFNIPAAYVGGSDPPGVGEDPFLIQLQTALAALQLGSKAEPVPTTAPLPDADALDEILIRCGLTPRHWQVQTRWTQYSYRDWLKIPAISEGLLGQMPVNERAAAIDAAFEDVDTDSWRWENWLGWTGSRASS